MHKLKLIITWSGETSAELTLVSEGQTPIKLPNSRDQRTGKGSIHYIFELQEAKQYHISCGVTFLGHTLENIEALVLVNDQQAQHLRGPAHATGMWQGTATIQVDP